MRFRVLVGSAIGAAALVLLAPGAAIADDPVDLGGAYVLDAAGALGTDSSEVKSSLDALYDRTGAQLFVVLVDTFTGAPDDQAWAEETAVLSGLGDSDALLAIAVDDRSYRYSVADGFPLSNDQIDQIAEARLIPALRDNDWAAGIVAFADGVGDEISGGGGIPILPVLGGAAILGVGAFVISRVLRRRRAGDAGAPIDQVDQKELDRRAGSLLVRLDDALTTSEQELGFAVAQFGEKSTAAFSAALTDARAQVKQAFALRQKLDDTEPETATEKRTMTLQIIELCESADGALEAQAVAFEQLRQLEKNAPQVIESVSADHAGVGARITAAAATIADLTARFGATGVASVSGSVEQARKLESFAATALEQGRSELATGDASGAAVAVRGAQQAVGQIGQLLAAVDKLSVDLPALQDRLAAATDDTRTDIAEARGATASPALTAAIGEAERVLTESTKRDPAAALTAVEAANAALNHALSEVRDRDAQVSRAATQVGRMTDEARATISAARDYIATRRGGVGAAARTRVAEAERQLTQALALAATDPIAALAAAGQAQSLGSAALDLARSDVSAFESSAFGGSAFDGSNSGNSGSSGGGFGGAVLGGILGGLLSGGSGSSGLGSSGSGSSGTGWSWGGGGGGWSGSRPGGFGGSSRPSRPISSPRSSGRRGGGGRF